MMFLVSMVILMLLFVYFLRILFVAILALMVVLLGLRKHMYTLFSSAVLLIAYISLDVSSALLIWLVIPCIICGTVAFSILGLGVRYLGLEADSDELVLAGTTIIAGGIVFVLGVGMMIIGIGLLLLGGAIHDHIISR